MLLGGLRKTSTLDFPGRLSAVVFIQGCNFACPYCHNPQLWEPAPVSPALTLDECCAFLARRRQRRLLEGVVLSGGEPAVNDDLPELCSRLRAMGYQIKLDTNGSRPLMLEKLIRDSLVDYVALDIKTLPDLYCPGLSREPGLEEALMASLSLLAGAGLEYEFRTTMVSPFVSVEMAEDLLRLAPPGGRWYLQPARLPHPAASGLRALSRPELVRIRDMAQAEGLRAFIRGE
ncbi:MAG: anaerobic ribonucleoside-triphosphate reductase activating protein [Desulfarculales bacterium]|jgi:pyruvate formate lyase activating enzyme|nr:anaerobic ribonucleoside-triphosphate reductase activating protein [Desulfarculales bacterium]